MRVGIPVLAAMCLYHNATVVLAHSPDDLVQPQTPTKYAVEGLAIGTRLGSERTILQDYRCSRSDQFEGLIWCQKLRNDRDRRGSYRVIDSILSSQEGKVSYVNHYQEPVVFTTSNANEFIESYSRQFGNPPRIIRMPKQPDDLDGLIALWGEIRLEPLDQDSLKLLADGKSLKAALLVDFIGNFARSAKQGLPIYRIGGGAGFMLASSFDQRGQGTLRIAAVNASEFSSASPTQASIIAQSPSQLPPGRSASEGSDAKASQDATKQIEVTQSGPKPSVERRNVDQTAASQGITKPEAAKTATEHEGKETAAKVGSNREPEITTDVNIADPLVQSDGDKAQLSSKILAWKTLGIVIFVISVGAFVVINRPKRRVVDLVVTSEPKPTRASGGPQRSGGQSNALHIALTCSVIGAAAVCTLAFVILYNLLWLALFPLVFIAYIQVTRLLEERKLARYKVRRPAASKGKSSLVQLSNAVLPPNRCRLPVRRSLIFLVDENCKPIPTEASCYILNNSVIAVFCHNPAVRIDYNPCSDVRSVTMLTMSDDKATKIAEKTRQLGVSGVATRLLAWVVSRSWRKGVVPNGQGADKKLRVYKTVSALIVFRDFSSIEIECSEAQFCRLRCILPEVVFSKERSELVDEQFGRIERMAGSGSRIPDLTKVIADLQTTRTRFDEVEEELSLREASLQAARYLLQYFLVKLNPGNLEVTAGSEGVAAT
jgi:hypothetical protein